MQEFKSSPELDETEQFKFADTLFLNARGVPPFLRMYNKYSTIVTVYPNRVVQRKKPNQSYSRDS